MVRCPKAMDGKVGTDYLTMFFLTNFSELYCVREDECGNKTNIFSTIISLFPDDVQKLPSDIKRLDDILAQEIRTADSGVLEGLHEVVRFNRIKLKKESTVITLCAGFGRHIGQRYVEKHCRYRIPKHGYESIKRRALISLRPNCHPIFHLDKISNFAK